MKRVGRIAEDLHPTLWQDFTFADDVMREKSVKERAKYAGETVHRFRKRFMRKYPGCWAIWKREWQQRKSGSLLGEWVPHYHTLIYTTGGRGPCSRAWDFADDWVACTRTREVHKALAVAMDERSFREIASLSSAVRYAVSYQGKADYQVFPESVGRFWGTIGDVPDAEGDAVSLSREDEYKLRRLLRGFVSHRKKRFRKSIAREGSCTFVMIKEDTVRRMVEFVQADRRARSTGPGRKYTVRRM